MESLRQVPAQSRPIRIAGVGLKGKGGFAGGTFGASSTIGSDGSGASGNALAGCPCRLAAGSILPREIGGGGVELARGLRAEARFVWVVEGDPSVLAQAGPGTHVPWATVPEAGGSGQWAL